MGPMLNIGEGHVFVELNYPHLIGFGICTASRSGDLAHRIIPVWNRSPTRDVNLHQSCQMTKSGQTMANRGQSTKQGLEGLTAAATDAVKDAKGTQKGLPPVHLWNPPFCGDLDIRIASDGTWFYMGTRIGRPALVRLFSTILKREGDKHFLVTPVEKVGIRVDDAPFMAVEMQKEDEGNQRVLSF